MSVPSTLAGKLSLDEAQFLFQAMLGRPLEDAGYAQMLMEDGLTTADFIIALRHSEELRVRAAQEREREETRRIAAARDEIAASDLVNLADSSLYRAPVHLTRSPDDMRRILIVGSCMSEDWEAVAGTLPFLPPAELHLFNAGLPDTPLHDPGTYAFQLVQLPLRAILPDASFARLAQHDEEAHLALFEQAVETMRWLLGTGMRWNRNNGLLSFVMSFPVPQQNPVGRLMPRFQLTNPVHFVERLNMVLADIVEEYDDAFYFDFDAVTSTIGKRQVQEDAIATFNHGGLIGDHDWGVDDGIRLEAAGRATDLYGDATREAIDAGWRELIAMYRTVRQIDPVKMVVIDLDDTLWRGVVAESAVEDLPTSEGWPLAFREALMLLKRRGTLLAIISKNEETRVREVWQSILGSTLALDDFAAVKINWHSKADNMQTILDQVNLLPGNVVFVDDNPAQRYDMQLRFPDMRMLGGNPVTWRHILLWAAETQVERVTQESANRTTMAQAQLRRERERAEVEPEAFIASLDVRVRPVAIEAPSAPGFNRALELVNKTNQFNTTGKRWTREELAAHLTGGGALYAFQAEDRFTDYGQVAVLLTQRATIVQMVMSCRVMGIGVEARALDHVISAMRRSGFTKPEAILVETAQNLPCRLVYARNGFTLADARPDGQRWISDTGATQGRPDPL